MEKLLPEFFDYDRISDILLFLSPNITLNFNVVLASKDRNGGRRFFQYETEYQSRYIGTDIARSIKRNMRFYFTLDNKTSFGDGFVIKPQDVFLLTKIIEEQIFPWFFDPKKRIFGIVENTLVIKGKYSPILYAQNDQRYLRFTPVVYSFEEGTFKEGIRMEVNHQSEYVDMEIDNFLGFYYILKRTDMYSAACALVNYVKTPPYGTNVFSMRGLGGGVPVPDWSEETPAKGTEKKNNFLDSLGKKGERK